MAQEGERDKKGATRPQTPCKVALCRPPPVGKPRRRVPTPETAKAVAHCPRPSREWKKKHRGAGGEEKERERNLGAVGCDRLLDDDVLSGADRGLRAKVNRGMREPAVTNKQGPESLNAHLFLHTFLLTR